MFRNVQRCTCCCFPGLYSRPFSPMGSRQYLSNCQAIPSPAPPIFLKYLLKKLNQQVQLPAFQTRSKHQPQFSSCLLIISTSVFCRQCKFSISKNSGHYILPSIHYSPILCSPPDFFSLINGSTNVPCPLSLNLRTSFFFFPLAPPSYQSPVSTNSTLMSFKFIFYFLCYQFRLTSTSA